MSEFDSKHVGPDDRSLYLDTDASWPSPLPSEEVIRNVFFNELSRSSRWDPQEHLHRVGAMVLHGGPFEMITRKLHRTLSTQTYTNRTYLSGRDVARGSQESAPLYKHTGMDGFTDLRKGVLVAIRPLMAEVLASDQDPQTKLDTVAMTMGTVIAEAQSFSDANTRVARTVHDYIKGGLDALQLEKITDVSRNFTPPSSIEQLVMMQNLTQLVEHPHDAVLNEDGVMAVSDKAMDLYLDAKGTLRELWQLDGLFDDYEWEENLTYDEKVKRIPEIEARIEAQLVGEDKELLVRARTALMQKHYAPAAVAAAFNGRPMPLPVNERNMGSLVETNIDLMKMRTRSLGVGMARRGIFMSVEKDDFTGRPTITEQYWVPSV